ncbi:hypothetical protein AC578_98 [Pseudocercospora eumusae]|uniref:Uncharacterized protein n=1 Tax=Pseudocercospora eumusae TaxID=321146 RepID=A0A139HP11_9PEZI|nr:hypothetical protein AC578_98 [Pseudocercospora eumusae]
MLRPTHSREWRRRYLRRPVHRTPFCFPLTPSDKPWIRSPTTSAQFFMSFNPQAESYTPQQAPYISPEGTSFAYEPRLLGNPAGPIEATSATREQSASEPFWHQYPSWTRQRLYYFPGFGFIDHPVYTDCAMDGSVTFIGYGTREGKKIANTDRPSQKRRHEEMVEIYVADEFVQNMPLRLLRRFSGAAKERFPTQEGTPSRSAKSRQADSKIDFGGDSKASTSPPRSPKGKKQMEIYLEGVEEADYPRITFVKEALNWMKSNDGESENLIDYGPSELSETGFLELLESYQAVVALQICPPSVINALRTELKNRVTEAVPEDVEYMLRDVTKYLPVEDAVTVRAITAAWDRWSDYVYTKDEWLGIKELLLNSENDALARKAKGIFDYRTNAKKKRLQQSTQGDRTKKTHHEDWRGPGENPEQNATKTAVSGGDGRRRNRRAQQARRNSAK